jgi:tRNA (cytidine/uridine-2'-O-)-methyltransferase
MNIGIVFYHPKNHLNLHDVAYIAYSVRAPLYVVKRPNTDYKLELLPEKVSRYILLVDDIREVVERESNSIFLIIETYATTYINEVEIDPSQRLVIVIGAEDYGLPVQELSKIGSYKLVKIPVAVEGMSYNVVSSLVMTLYELRRRYGEV